jgi:hypothetical protein
MNDFIPCAGSLTFVVVILAFIVVMRYLSYKETLSMAEKGYMPPVRVNGKGKATLIWGIIITALGLALMIGLLPLGVMLNANVPFGFGPWMLAGLLPTFFGLALILIHVLTREPQPKNEKNDPAEKIEN